MKINRILSVLMLFIGSQLFFACNTAKYYDFGGSSTAYRDAKKAEAKAEPVMAENALATAETPAEPLNLTEKPGNTYLEASAAENTPVISSAPVYEIETEQETEVPATIGNQVVTGFEPVAAADLKKNGEKKKQKKGWFSGIKSPKATVLEIVLAILLPPVAVAIHEGITWRFWVSILLWILGILPGIIFALLIVTDSI